jgi:hypothetical protein
LWEGPEIFVFVDHEERVAEWDRGGFGNAAGNPLASLRPYISRGRDVGLHLVVSRLLDQWGRTMSNPIISELVKAKAPAVLMDGDPGEGPIIRGIKSQRQPKGRGIYITDNTTERVQIALTVAT